jgi:hypothetical protein
MQTVTLKAEDFRTVHNTLCELREVEQRLNEVISEQMVQRLHRVIKGFEQGLADAYRQDNEQFESKMDYYSEFQKNNQLKTIWSIYELPIHGFLGEHPYKGAQQLAYKQHWGDGPVFEEIQGPTWADLYRAADRCIQRSGDQHHCFIESFVVNPQQPDQLLLTTGS